MAKYTGGQVLTDSIEGLKKKKFTLATMTFFIYCACAGGAFGIESMISAAGPGLTLLLLVLIPFLWGLPIGLYSSELSNLAPVESGPYVWMKMAFGEFWGFSMGWWIVLANYLTGAAYVVLAVDYMGMFFTMTPAIAFALKAAIIIIFTIINLRGLEEVSIASTIFSIIILIGFAAVTFVGFANWQYSPIDPFMASGQDALSSWGVGIAVGIWMYCGYICISFLGGELENPEILPKGMKLGIFVIALSYILPTFAGIVSTGPWYDWGTSIDYSTVLTQHVGTWAGMAFMIVAVVGQCAIFNAAITAASRSFMVLAEDNLCPRFLAKLSPNTKVPVWAILLLGAINLILVNMNFEILVTILSPVLFVLYVGLAFAFVKIRKTHPVELRGDLYYVKGGKLAEIYICGGPLLLGLVGMLVNGTEYFLLGFIGIFFVVPLYIILKPVYGGFTKRDPEQFPINPKTKLAPGDITRFGIFCLIFGVICFFGSFWLVFYEGSWGPEYYLATYGSGLMSDFWAMIGVARWAGAAMLIVGAVLALVGKKADPIPKEDY